VLKTARSEGETNVIPVNVLPTELEVEEVITFEDGLVSAQVASASETEILVTIQNQGEICGDSRMYVKGTSELEAGITQQVTDDIEFAVGHEVDFVAVSYHDCSDSEHDVLKQFPTKILAKIEKELDS
jgi:pyruvate kinase